ncbi:MAG TPA: hypothetical protein VKY31_12720 [Terriglobia bacterium]|nr:hypothetical protein [Terriglobia bacterium]
MAIVGLTLALLVPQAEERPAYAREGDRIEQEFLAHRDKLITFFSELRNLLDQQQASPGVTLPRLQAQDAPPQSVGIRFGYGVLPRIIDNSPSGTSPVSVFSYSWPITDGYIAGERTKLDQAEQALKRASTAPSDQRASMVAGLVGEYRKLLNNQRTIDQYIQYNQFWQRSIAQDRVRFDQLTKVYELMKSDDPDITEAIRDVLGKPAVPPFVTVDQAAPDHIVVRVPVYTDIDDAEFLSKAKSAIEDLWQARDGETVYCVEIEFRHVPAVAQAGDHIDVRTASDKFPQDGAVLTTGAQTTHSFVGRYIALAPGDLPARTLAHEFGHVLGFHDGYIRGYRDLGDQGFEILELTSVFDDIMSAPREGHVQAAHFRLLIDAMK